MTHDGGGGDASQRTLHLHVGLPKTASTWLQTHVYPKLQHLHVRSMPRSRLFCDRADLEGEQRLLASVFRRSSALWDGHGDDVFAELFGERSAWLAEPRDALLSEEAVGREGSRPVLLAAHLEAMGRTARRWGFGRLHVIVFVRRQDHWLASHYAQMSDRNPRASQRDFAATVERVLDPARARYSLGTLLDYARLRRHIVDVVGPQNLTLIAYEALSEDPGGLLSKLLHRLGTPQRTIDALSTTVLDERSNVSNERGAWRLRPRSLRLPARGARATFSMPRWADVGRGPTIALTPQLSGAILAEYEASNRALAAEEGLDLTRFGYYPPARTRPTAASERDRASAETRPASPRALGR